MKRRTYLFGFAAALGTAAAVAISALPRLVGASSDSVRRASRKDRRVGSTRRHAAPVEPTSPSQVSTLTTAPVPSADFVEEDASIIRACSLDVATVGNWAALLRQRLEVEGPAGVAILAKRWLQIRDQCEAKPSESSLWLLCGISEYAAGREDDAIEAISAGAFAFDPVEEAFASDPQLSDWPLFGQIFPAPRTSTATFDHVLSYYQRLVPLLSDREANDAFGSWLERIATTHENPDTRAGFGLWMAALRYSKQLMWSEQMQRLMDVVTKRDASAVSMSLAAERRAAIEMDLGAWDAAEGRWLLRHFVLTADGATPGSNASHRVRESALMLLGE